MTSNTSEIEELSLEEKEQRRLKALERFNHPQEEIKIIQSPIPKVPQLSAEEIAKKKSLALKREQALIKNQMELDSIFIEPKVIQKTETDPEKRRKCLSGIKIKPEQVAIPQIKTNTNLEKFINAPNSDFFLEGNDGIRIGVHKVIICARSSVFYAIVTSSSAEALNGIFRFNQFSSNVIRLMITFLYSGQVRVNNQNIAELIYLAEYLKLETLKLAIEQELQKYLDLDNLITLWEISEENKMEGLKLECLQYCVKNSEAKKIVSQMPADMKSQYFKIIKN